MPMFTQSYSELDPGQTEESLSSKDDFDYDVDLVEMLLLEAQALTA